MPALSRKQRIWLLLLGIAFFTIVAHSAYRALSQTKVEQEAGSSGLLSKGMIIAEDLTLNGLGDSKSGLESYRGKVIVINFWAGWCPPCIHEMPALYELQRRLEKKGLVVLGVNMDDNPEDGLRTLKKRVGPAPFPMFRGMGTNLADRFGIDGLPFTVVLDRDRKIHYMRPGEVSWTESEVVKLIEGLL